MMPAEQMPEELTFTITDVTINGAAAGDQFGYSVSSAGDVNGDGFSDVIVGAILNDAGGSNAGRAYVYFGGSAVNNVSDVIMTGAAANDRFGYSVSSAGDMNGDGFSDVLAGAPLNDIGGGNIGRTYLYVSSAPSVKPIFNLLKDVPNDQGGQVYLKWARSGYDIQGIDKVISYSVLRSFPPVNGNFSWQTVAEISAEQIPFYSFVDHTPVDSTANNSGTFFYRIKAKTTNISEYWYSGILSGRSLDNIPPLVVSPFNAVSESSNIRLTWNKNTEPDLYNYILYRSVSPTIDPETESPYATVTDSTYLDTTPLTGAYYYFIVAQDVHNNKSPVAITESPNMTLNLTMFIEGFYNAGSNSQVSDTILVELRNSASPFAIADQSTALVSANGSVQLKFGNATNGNYYIAVKHRNSIETWSAGVIALSRTTPASFDLASSLSQAFGNNQKQVDTSPVRFAIYSGDINQDGTIDASDVSDTDNDAFSSVSGYVRTDVTGDDFVDAGDVSIVDNNAFNAVSVVTP
ncbi:MAG: FG-GAP repeat protein [Ignavibacteria bacterium]|nr:FG-GAP repeat protein [Ignavibacteria bacterium]